MNDITVSCAELPQEPDCAKIEDFCDRVLLLEGIREWELSVLLCGNSFIQALNKKYRGKDEPTDVLSFNQNQNPGNDGLFTAGDIVISLDYIENAADLKRCLVHGILHLEGMEHQEEGEYREMIDRQEKILEKLQDELPEVYIE